MNRKELSQALDMPQGVVLVDQLVLMLLFWCPCPWVFVVLDAPKWVDTLARFGLEDVMASFHGTG